LSAGRHTHRREHGLDSYARPQTERAAIVCVTEAER